jgi:hypothetical protein
MLFTVVEASSGRIRSDSAFWVRFRPVASARRSGTLDFILGRVYTCARAEKRRDRSADPGGRRVMTERVMGDSLCGLRGWAVA